MKQQIAAAAKGTETIRLRLPIEVLRQLRRIADADSRTVSSLVRKLIVDGIGRQQQVAGK